MATDMGEGTQTKIQEEWRTNKEDYEEKVSEIKAMVFYLLRNCFLIYPKAHQ